MEKIKKHRQYNSIQERNIMKTTAAIIPARFTSKRFPGKPLAKINGIPMLVRVYQRAKELIDDVYVATDSLKIKELCEAFGMPCVMTKEDHRTGTDRCAEAALLIEKEYDYYFNIQGDEPIFPTEAISLAYDIIDEVNIENGYGAINFMSKIYDEKDVESVDVPKVITVKTFSEDDNLLYMSRSPIPFKRENTEVPYFKQIGLYCFDRQTLLKFAYMHQGPLECAESIEILRCVEAGIPVLMLECKGASFSVDRPEDIVKIEHIINTSEE